MPTRRITSAEREAVYRWSHEDGQLQTVAGSLSEFRDNLCVWFEEFKKDAEGDNH